MITAHFPTKPLEVLASDKSGGSFWYLATPYARYPEGREEALKETCVYANILLQAGIPVYSPIIHNHSVAEQTKMTNHDSHDFWLPLDVAVLRGAHGMLIAPMAGWRLSKGIGMEIEAARVNDIPVFLLDVHW